MFQRYEPQIGRVHFLRKGFYRTPDMRFLHDWIRREIVNKT